ncbi:MAG: hypothetical protein MR964_00855 [Campylobacter sp.]|nr:hypothetical protein [Campylobacter sp.]MCI7022772.1 hypothetical protein [Campylobacter sp.]MCI7581814.1 hypothetical protein [Campylobacter sp.]MDY4153800.1 hypothetical protein [Campylobacter sp.]
MAKKIFWNSKNFLPKYDKANCYNFIQVSIETFGFGLNTLGCKVQG